jgi:signal transduction histidine kinase
MVGVGRALAAAALVVSVVGFAAIAGMSGLSGPEFEVVLGDYVPQFALIGAGFGSLAWLVLPREPRNAVVWVYLAVAVFAGVYLLCETVVFVSLSAEGITISNDVIATLSPRDIGVVPATAVMVGSLFISPSIFWLLSLGILLFPDGRLPSRRWRPVVWLAVVSSLVTGGILAALHFPSSSVTYGAVETDYDALISVPLMGLVFATLLSFVALVLRFRSSTGVQRQQIRWILYGTALAVPALAAAVLAAADASLIVLAALAVFIACFSVALTRYKVYEIDLVISRSISFGVLAAFITAVYAFVVAGVGSLVGAGTSNLALSITATALVAVVFEPVRERIQRVANRLVYGARATPYQVLSDLTARLASAESTEGLLERIVERLTEGTGATRAVLRIAGRGGIAVVWPPDAALDDADGEFTAPIRFGGEELGSLAVLKDRGDALTPTERSLVEDLAGSAGMVLNKVRLDADLEARADELTRSRRRLIDAQAEERQRLERDLHDGAQQQVVALKVKLGLAQRFALQEGAEQAAAFIGQMADDAQSAIDEIRALGKGIFPPLLEDEGLRAAVAAGAANAPVPVVVRANGLGRFPTEIEAAAYFCITEAVTNAIKYSGADRIDVTLTGIDGGLLFVVEDGGEGFDPDERAMGSGLMGMRDRLEALGGTLSVESSSGSGTRVAGVVAVSAV